MVIQQYRAGASIEKLVRRYEVHRTTVMHHLDQSDVARLTPMHKKNDETGALAAAQYEQGASLELVASEFGVHQRTVAREFRRAGAPIRPRRGRRS